MVSFFGLKFGGDKKKKGTSPPAAATQWKKVDQNQLGEGQFFGTKAQRKGALAGSVRSAARPGTARGPKSPYDLQTHSLAASSMYDLAQTNGGRSRAGSFASLKPFASEANLRARFAGAGAAGDSLAPPSPGFAGGGGGGRPWVNPLDVHFGRPATPSSGGPRSPLGQFELPPTPGGGGAGGDGDSSSLFGDLMPETVAEAISNKVALAQEEARARADAEARARARAELEEQARRNAEATRSPALAAAAAAAAAAARGPAAARPPPMPPVVPGGGLPSPRFQGAAAREGRPGSRNGERRVATPTAGDGRPGSRNGERRVVMPAASEARPGSRNGERRVAMPAANDARPGSRNGERRVMTPSGRGERPGFRPRDPRDREPRAATPTNSNNSNNAPRYHPGPHGLPSPPLSHGTRPSEDQASTASSASGSVSGGSNASPIAIASSAGMSNNGAGGGRPVIQNVRAKRDTLQLHPPRRRSLTMKIEELELSLVTAQEEFLQKEQQQHGEPPQPPPQQAPQRARVVSAASSYYGDDEPAEAAAFGPPLSPMSPGEAAPPAPPFFTPLFAQSSSPRPQSPAGRDLRGRAGPPRPLLGEYGVPLAPRADSPVGRAPPRAQSPAPTAAAIAAAAAGEGTALRPRRRPTSPVPRSPLLQNPPGPGARNQSPTGRASAGGKEARPKRRPMSPITIPPRARSPTRYAVRGQSPAGRPGPQSPLGRAIRSPSPPGSGGRGPVGPVGPGDEPSSFLRKASGLLGKTAADNNNTSSKSSDSSSSSNDSGGGLAFRQANWGSPASTPQSSVPPTPTIPAEASASANWPLPGSPAPRSPPSPAPSGALPAVPSHHQRRGRPPPINIAAAQYADEAGGTANHRGPWTPQARPAGFIGSPLTAAAAAEDGGADGPMTPGAAGGKILVWGADEEQQLLPRGRPSRRPDHGLKSPTGIADEHGTGFI